MVFERLEEAHLEGIAKLWNEELGERFPVRVPILKQTICGDANWLQAASQVVLDPQTKAVLGFISVKYAGERLQPYGIDATRGWIQALMVSSSARKAGIGTRLLEQAEAELHRRGVRDIVLGNDLFNRLFPGIPDDLPGVKIWFEKRGYVKRDTMHDLLRIYSNVEEALPALEGEETLFRLATAADREQLTDFMARCFPGTWDYQQRQYWEHGGTGREFVLLEHRGEIIGFCRINDGQSPLYAQNIYWSPLFTESLGGVGPLGIDERHRGRQYGIKIVQAAIHELLLRGNRAIVIDTTPFVDFYGKLGYKTWRSYVQYQKSIVDAASGRLSPDQTAE